MIVGLPGRLGGQQDLQSEAADTFHIPGVDTQFMAADGQELLLQSRCRLEIENGREVQGFYGRSPRLRLE